MVNSNSEIGDIHTPASRYLFHRCYLVVDATVEFQRLIRGLLQ